MKEVESSKFDEFIARNSKSFAALLIILVLFTIVSVILVGTNASNIQRDLSKIFESYYILTNNNQDLSQEQVDNKKLVAIDTVKPYCVKKGIVGVRANLLIADIFFSKQDYQNAKDYYNAASSISKKAYTSPLSTYNMAVCCEELGNKEEAFAAYQAVANNKNFYLWTHAAFNAARLCENMNDYKKALELYNALFDESPLDQFAILAHDRVIFIEVNNLAQ